MRKSLVRSPTGTAARSKGVFSQQLGDDVARAVHGREHQRRLAVLVLKPGVSAGVEEFANDGQYVRLADAASFAAFTARLTVRVPMPILVSPLLCVPRLRRSVCLEALV